MLLRMARWLELRGRDYPRLGPLAHAALADGGALALSRGEFHKPYAHVDPNEDGALLFRDGAAALLAVVDGFNGVAASEAGLDAVREHAPALAAAPDEDFERCMKEALASGARALAGERRSRSCVLVAVIAGGVCRWASVGDCALWRAGADAAVTERDNRIVLGPGLVDGVPEGVRWSGRFELRAGERVALMSDGVLNFVPDGDWIGEILRDAPDDATAAVALARAAMESGAGDNVAVAAFTAPAR